MINMEFKDCDGNLLMVGDTVVSVADYAVGKTMHIVRFREMDVSLSADFRDGIFYKYPRNLRLLYDVELRLDEGI